MAEQRNDPPAGQRAQTRRSREELPHPQAGQVTEHEIEDIETHSRLRTPVLYEIVRREGELEMQRPATSLWWSGVAAGLSISFSSFTQAILYLHLPAANWRLLVTSIGYSVGFLMVVLGRQQLFTENTITVVLPVMAEPSLRNVRRLARMWGIVFVANMAGTLFAALFCTFTPAISGALREAMLTLAQQMLAHGWVEMLFLAVAAGFLMAAMVWLIPSAEGGQSQVIVLATWLIAVGGFEHIVAGSMDTFMLVLNHRLALGDMLLHFTLPVLLGNIIGGTALFTVLSYAQVMKEM
jgi:formate/nitrite transporter FocA (FNT family)